MVKIFVTDISKCDYNQNQIESFCELRKNYVNSISDDKRKRQSVFAWLLLEFALNKFNIKGTFSLSNIGKWYFLDNSTKFSIAHSENIVAIAIADSDYIGIDVEKCSEKLLKLKKRLGEYNKGNLSELEYLAREWTRRESIYKAGTKAGFYSRKIFDKDGDEYFLTICSDGDIDEYIYVDCKKLV